MLAEQTPLPPVPATDPEVVPWVRRFFVPAFGGDPSVRGLAGGPA